MEQNKKIIQNVQRWLNNNCKCPKCKGVLVVRKIRTAFSNKDAYEVRSRCMNCDSFGQGWHKSNGDVIDYKESQKLYENLHNELEKAGYEVLRINPNNVGDLLNSVIELEED